MIENILEKSLLIELGIEDADPKVQEQVIDDFMSAVIKKMLVHAFEVLPEDKKAELLATQDSDDSEKTEQFLKDNIPDFDKVILAIIDAEKEEYMNTVAELTE